MGNGDIIANMGISYLLISFAIIFLSVFIFVGVCLSRKYAFSEKIQEKFREYQESLLYNPFIRYTMLNCLKLNNTGMVAFMGLATGKA